MTAVRVSPPELGDRVVIQGLGLVGQFASQLYQLGGAKVLAIDPSASRRDIARKCGIEGVVDPSTGDIAEQIKALTDGEGAAVIVEATGVPALAHTATTFAAPRGEVILLGSPRGEHQTDLTQFLDQVHLWNNGCVTLQGCTRVALPDPEVTRLQTFHPAQLRDYPRLDPRKQTPRTADDHGHREPDRLSGNVSGAEKRTR
jgi:threonine dehydrogenase-like Zn-dependent dehydrogenase